MVVVVVVVCGSVAQEWFVGKSVELAIWVSNAKLMMRSIHRLSRVRWMWFVVKVCGEASEVFGVGSVGGSLSCRSRLCIRYRAK
jgi:hypothetical protein